MELIDFTISLAKKAGRYIVKESQKGFSIEYKGERDVVTNIDRETEKLIKEEILKQFPNHGFLAEESEFLSKSKLKNLAKSPVIWIIDPIDGTDNFTHNIPHYCVSIAAFKTKSSKKSKNFEYLEGELIVGVIYNPITKELYYAEKGKGAFLNESKIHVSNTSVLEESTISNEFRHDHTEEYLNFHTAIIDLVQVERRMGSGALSFAYVAAGRFDAAVAFGLKPWDVAAGLLILNEAGGTVTDLNGNLIDLFSPIFLASNTTLHKDLIDLISQE